MFNRFFLNKIPIYFRLFPFLKKNRQYCRSLLNAFKRFENGNALHISCLKDRFSCLPFKVPDQNRDGNSVQNTFFIIGLGLRFFLTCRLKFK